MADYTEMTAVIARALVAELRFTLDVDLRHYIVFDPTRIHWRRNLFYDVCGAIDSIRNCRTTTCAVYMLHYAAAQSLTKELKSPRNIYQHNMSALVLSANKVIQNFEHLLDAIDRNLAQVRRWQEEAIAIAVEVAWINVADNFKATVLDLARNVVAVMQCTAQIDITENVPNTFTITVNIANYNTGLFDVFLFADTIREFFDSLKLCTINNSAYVWHGTKT